MVEIGNKNILEELANATNDISQGELIQLDAIRNIKISLNKLKKISYFKTGRLFEAAARTGAMLSNSNRNYINNVSECAKNLGILFQIRDDMLDYSSDLEIGKPSYQDLREGKVTYPFFYAYQNGNTRNKKNLFELLGKNKLNQSKAKTLIQNLNGIQKTQQLAEKYHVKTVDCANKINDLFVRKEMIELADIALKRDK